MIVVIAFDWLKELPMEFAPEANRRSAKARMAAGSEEEWKEAYEAVKLQFELIDLLPEQQEAIKALFKGRNVFVNLPTGFGMSLIF